MVRPINKEVHYIVKTLIVVEGNIVVIFTNKKFYIIRIICKNWVMLSVEQVNYVDQALLSLRSIVMSDK